MKRIIFLGIALMSFSFFVTAQQSKTTNTVPENPNAPEISFDKTTHDYGTIFQNADGGCEFTFKNTGKEPLILSNVISSCGCTVPKWTREPILPGQSGVIKVNYDTKRLGTISKQITVLSNAKTDRVVLKIAGTILAEPKEEMPEKQVSNDASPVNKR